MSPHCIKHSVLYIINGFKPYKVTRGVGLGPEYANKPLAKYKHITINICLPQLLSNIDIFQQHTQEHQ